MNSKKLAVCMLSATLFIQSTTATVYAKQTEIKTLTLETAIKSAQNTSTSLKMQERGTDLAKESADMAKLVGGYYAYDPANVNYQYMEKQKEVMKDNIELSVTQLFDTILLSEAKLENIKITKELQEKQIQKSKLEFEKGLQSELHLEEINLKLAQTQQEQLKLEQDIDNMYRQLCELIGTSKQRYNLERPEITFEPYKDVKNLENFASDKAKKHIDLWKASEDLRVVLDTPIFTQDYMDFISKKAERENKKDSLKMTEEQLEGQIQNTYIEMKKLETDYQMKQQDLIIKEKQQKINDVYLDQGMMSQLEYDLSKLQYETSKLEVRQLINKHYYLKFKLDHPHLISASGM